jgi:hypothetical protein
MIIAATGYFRVVDTVGIRIAGEIHDPTPQRVVLRKVGRDMPYTVGIQLKDEAIIRGAARYSTIKAAWADFETYTNELVEDGYIGEAPARPRVSGGLSDRISLVTGKGV